MVGFPPKSSILNHFNRVFHYEPPSILGVFPLFLGNPHISQMVLVGFFTGIFQATASWRYCWQKKCRRSPVDMVSITLFTGFESTIQTVVLAGFISINSMFSTLLGSADIRYHRSDSIGGALRNSLVEKSRGRNVKTKLGGCFNPVEKY